jgi:uncharacterized protein (TIGR00730 family)
MKPDTVQFSFKRTDNEIDRAIDQLIGLVDNTEHPDLIREMIIAALKAGREDNDRAHMRLMNSTMKEMRFTGKIFGPYSGIRKVTVFGSARTGPDEPIYEMARQFGKMLADAGYMIITGAGSGIMQAANEGAGPERSFGVNILLPFEQKPNPVLVGNPRLITYKYFFNRKVAFLKEADAVALFPGGFGTLDEAMETLTLLQTGKHAPLPLVLIDEPGGTYWARWMKFLREELLSEGYIEDNDFNLFERVYSIETAVHVINTFYRRYHSMRYVDKKLVIRMLSAIDDASVSQLKERFNDILHPGGQIRICGALPEEDDEPEIAHLPRLVVDFNLQDFGRMRTLINEINAI